MLVSKIQTNQIQQNKLNINKPVTNPQVVSSRMEFPRGIDAKSFVNINFKSYGDDYDDDYDDYDETPAERRERERRNQEAELRAERDSLIDSISFAYGDDPEGYARMRPVIDNLNRANGRRNVSSSPAINSYSGVSPENRTSRVFNETTEELSYADRMALLDRMNRFDYFDRISEGSNIAPALKRQLEQMNASENTSDAANYLKSQGRRVIEALGNSFMVLLKDDELLPDMRINGFDYYMTQDGRLYVDSKRCPEYPIVDEENDTGDDFYNPMFDEIPDYLWINGFGCVSVWRDIERCKSIRNEQTNCYYADENYYFRLLSRCREENYNLVKDVNGIYYIKVPAEKLPYSLEGGSIYMNLRDGSWHSQSSEAFQGRPVSVSNQYNQPQQNAASREGYEIESPNNSYTTETPQRAGEEKQTVVPAAPPFKIERMEFELTSTDENVKSIALNDLLEYINSNTFNPKFEDNLGRNIVHLSILSRDERIKNIISRAISKGVDINAGNKFGQTPLMLAIKNLITAKNEDEKSVDLSNIKFILEQNPDVNVQDQNKQTAFHLACMSTSVALLTLLLSKNPNILLKDKLGKRAAEYLKTDAMKEIYKQYIKI